MQQASIELDGPHRGIHIAYVDWGNPAAERVILCVHGLTRNCHDFDFLATALANENVRVIAVDVVGRGHSSKLINPKNYTVVNYAQQMRRFHALLNLPRVDWIGTSMGGIIGMLLAAEDNSPINRLILNDIGPFVGKKALEHIKAYLGLDLVFADLNEVERHLRFIHVGFGHLTNAQWRHLAIHSAYQKDAGWRLRYDPAIRIPYLEIASADIDLWPVWHKIHCPTYVLRGEESPILDYKTAEAMKIRGPHAELMTFTNVSHAPALMSSDQIFTIQHWLEL